MFSQVGGGRRLGFCFICPKQSFKSNFFLICVFAPERLESANKQLASKTQENQESNQGTVAKLLAQSKSPGARLCLTCHSRDSVQKPLCWRKRWGGEGGGWELFALPQGGLCCSGRWMRAINPGRPAG